MENTSTQRASLPWKFALLSPMAVALALLLTASRQANLHDEVRLTTIGNLMVAVGIAAQGFYWLIARKSQAIGISALVAGSVLFGFGLHTLLRVLGL
jgi:hypothetical protein